MKIFLLGFMGAGKSYWGRHLSEYMSLPLYDLDERIVEEEGRSIADIFKEKGESYFRQKERDTLRQLSAADRFIIACGGGAPCFFDNMDFMNEQGFTVWLNPPVEVMAERLQRKKGKRPLLRDLDGGELMAFIRQKLGERRPFYQQARLVVDPERLTIVTFAEKIQQCIKLT